MGKLDHGFRPGPWISLIPLTERSQVGPVRTLGSLNPSGAFPLSTKTFDNCKSNSKRHAGQCPVPHSRQEELSVSVWCLRIHLGWLAQNGQFVSRSVRPIHEWRQT